MHKIHGDKAQMLKDTVQSHGGWVLSVIVGKKLGRATFLVPGTPCLYNAKQTPNTCFAFYLLWSKQKSPSDFFPLEKIGTDAGLLKKQSGLE